MNEERTRALNSAHLKALLLLNYGPRTLPLKIMNGLHHGNRRNWSIPSKLTMESCLALTMEEARTYSSILDAVSQLPRSDPRYGFVIGMTWWLLHRRRRLEQARNRRRQFYRRWRRMLTLRWQMQRNFLASVSIAMKTNEFANLEEWDSLPAKRLWVKEERGDGFWSQVDKDEVSEEAFRSSFHMSRETFNFLYNELEEHLKKSNTTMRESIPGKKRLAATLFRLATNAEYHKVANSFGIGKSTTTSLVREVCEIIVTNLKTKYLNFTPGTEETEPRLKERIIEASRNFEIPQCIGVLGCTDVYIVGSSWDWSETSPYTSIYSKNFSLVFQAVVNDRGQFNHVSAGCPASLPNSAVLQKSNLKEVIAQKFAHYQENIESVDVPVLLAAYDTSFGYPRQNWVLTPFRDDDIPNDPQTRENFNEKLRKGKEVFSETILKLRSRFAIFHGKNGKINFNIDIFESISMACCILHNICDLRKDPVDPEWMTEVGDQLLIRTSGVDVSSEVSSEEKNHTENGHGVQSTAEEVQALLADIVRSRTSSA
ncbi:unnamed protein product [Allacma fusca]|uniref:DDE Tnp4 domain-containing protein n=1 Tax=Allacma fusca TaxID=39272 RepID=A0A8J2P7G0_9HEXA|nr:unnamed protein product [Allacma fusca]